MGRLSHLLRIPLLAGEGVRVDSGRRDPESLLLVPLPAGEPLPAHHAAHLAAGAERWGLPALRSWLEVCPVI